MPIRRGLEVVLVLKGKHITMIVILYIQISRLIARAGMHHEQVRIAKIKLVMTGFIACTE